MADSQTDTPEAPDSRFVEFLESSPLAWGLLVLIFVPALIVGIAFVLAGANIALQWVISSV